ncbi:MAG TPA: sigma-70 family RNA polymerase sigma factor, partial [Mangrovimonas sp.]|nr:sigma-70 family RNA polymerase sigma factor [Mangrovimonas sp.]
GKFIPQDQTSVNGYLYTVAKNKWMDYLRSNKYKKTKLVEDERQLEIHQDSFFSTSIDDKIENERLLDKAMDAFKNLGLPCKNLLMKFYFEKKSMREIAEELELDEASTRNKKYRCMEKLRELALKS